MKKAILQTLLIALGASLCAQEKKADTNPAVARWEAAFNATKEELQKPLRDLADFYEEKLKSIAEDRKKRGDLDAVLLVEKEIGGFRKNAFPEIPDSFTALKAAREVYLRELEQRKARYELNFREAAGKHARAVEDYQAELTKSDRLEEAVKVKKYLEEFLLESGPGRPEIVLYWESNFRGSSTTLKVPCEVFTFYGNPNFKNDSLKSIRVPEGVKVTVGKARGLTGGTTTFTGDVRDIQFGGISSLKAELVSE